MTTASLAAGGALLAFGPAGALLLVLVSHKANLVIVVTTSAFAYLCSAVVSALLWLPVPEALRGNPYAIIFPSVAVQFFFRAGYVWLYHRIEDTVEKSIERHSVARARGQTRRQQQHGGPSDQSDDSENDPARLRLELNDWSSGLAAGCGFGGMHAALLYGTLLASEVGNLGTLYQPSCDIMPSLVNAAVVAALFSICDCLWMLLTFFGMRRRRDKRDRLGAGFGAGADALARYPSFSSFSTSSLVNSSNSSAFATMHACSATNCSTHFDPRSCSSARMKHESASTNPSPHELVLSPSTHGHSSAFWIASSFVAAPSPRLTASAKASPVPLDISSDARDRMARHDREATGNCGKWR